MYINSFFLNLHAKELDYSNYTAVPTFKSQFDEWIKGIAPINSMHYVNRHHGLTTGKSEEKKVKYYRDRITFKARAALSIIDKTIFRYVTDSEFRIELLL